MDQLITRITEFWNSLSTGQRLLYLGLPAVLIVGAVAAMTLLVSAPETKVLLYKDLELADAGMIVAELKRQDIEYELANDGRDILVPASSLYELRLELAAMGLPRDSVGFELFDKSKLGITESGLRIDYQRALSGELVRTLESLEQVHQARVILQIAPETSFLDTATHSTASVALTLAPNGRLSESQVEGIRHMVSHAVSRLAPEDVTIVDSSGRELTGNDDYESEKQYQGMELAKLRHELQQRLERQLEQKLRTFLEDPYGAGNVATSVTLDMDFRAIHTQSTEYTPVVGDQGVEKRLEEHRSRNQEQEETPGGVPGTTSNIPGYLGISGSEAQTLESSEYDLIVDYLVNEELREEDLPPGMITRRSAAVAISTDVWDAATKRTVDNLVASAIGADVANGDVIDVQAFEFAEAGVAPATVEYVALQRTQSISRIAGWALALILIVVALLFLRSLVLTVLPREVALATASEDVTPPALTFASEEEVEEFALRRLDELSSTAQDKMRTEISRMIDKEPERVAHLIRSWLLEDT
ncbi:flagellar M-ring protein FliF [bacterium]|nr:flagellar M-ring protein FliF [bacterium]